MPLGTSFPPLLLLPLLAFCPSTSLTPLQRPKQTKFPKMVSLLLLRSSLHLRRRRRLLLEGEESKKEGDTLSFFPVRPPIAGVRSVPRPDLLTDITARSLLLFAHLRHSISCCMRENVRPCRMLSVGAETIDSWLKSRIFPTHPRPRKSAESVA